MPSADNASWADRLAARRHRLDQMAAELDATEAEAKELLAQVAETRGLLNAAEDDLLRDDLALLEATDG